MSTIQSYVISIQFDIIRRCFLNIDIGLVLFTSGHRPVSLSNIKILATDFRTTKERKTTEALFIKQHKPDINAQEASIPLRLF